MPYMIVYKGWDDKWHRNPCAKSKPEIGVFVLLKDEKLRLGEGRKDPPLNDMCPECFKALYDYESNLS